MAREHTHVPLLVAITKMDLDRTPATKSKATLAMRCNANPSGFISNRIGSTADATVGTYFSSKKCD